MTYVRFSPYGSMENANMELPTQYDVFATDFVIIERYGALQRISVLDLIRSLTQISEATQPARVVPFRTAPSVRSATNDDDAIDNAVVAARNAT